MKGLRWALLLRPAACGLLGLAGCSGGSPSVPFAGRPGSASGGHPGSMRIVASIAPLADLARRVGGDSIEVLTLVPPGVSEHTWDPAPRDVARLRGIDLFFQVGFGFEPWAGKLVEAGGSPFTSVDASVGVEPIDESEPHADPRAEAAALGTSSGTPGAAAGSLRAPAGTAGAAAA